MLTDKERKSLGSKLKSLVKKSGQSGQAWAEQIGMAQSTFSTVLSGKPKRMTHYDTIANALGHDIVVDGDGFHLVGRGGATQADGSDDLTSKLLLSASRARGGEGDTFERRVEEEAPAKKADSDTFERRVEEETPARKAERETFERLVPSDKGVSPLVLEFADFVGAPLGITRDNVITLALAHYHESRSGLANKS